MTTIYLDACCLNRPFDDQSQPRIRLEAEAVVLIINLFQEGVGEWVSSEVVDDEIEQTPDPDRRQRVKDLMSSVQKVIEVDQTILDRAQELGKLGFQSFDALHLACAEKGEADVFLTTDDKLQRRATRYAKHLSIAVGSPLDWVRRG